MAAVGRSKLTRAAKTSKRAARRTKIASGIDAMISAGKVAKAERAFAAFVKGAAAGCLEGSAEPQKKDCGGCANGGCSKKTTQVSGGVGEQALHHQNGLLMTLAKNGAALNRTLSAQITQLMAENRDLVDRLIELVTHFEDLAEENKRLRTRLAEK